MWVAILAIVGELIKFLCKWGVNQLDTDTERKKKREEIKKNEIEKAETQRDLILAINRYNNV